MIILNLKIKNAFLALLLVKFMHENRTNHASMCIIDVRKRDLVNLESIKLVNYDFNQIHKQIDFNEPSYFDLDYSNIKSLGNYSLQQI